jgi:protein-disulfide isomerase
MKNKLTLFLGVTLSCATIAFVQHPKADARAPNEMTSSAEILHDPQIPAEGNTRGDLTIVEYFDYQCLTCKKVNPILQQLVREDGHIRLVFKDWPIFGGVSVYAARLALAAKFQNKFSEAHQALISMRKKLTREGVVLTLAKVGIDVTRAERDLAIHQREIETILSRNQEQATTLGYKGAPAFVIGNFRVPPIFNTANFKEYIAYARSLSKREAELGR